MHLAGTAAAADKSIDPSARKKRGPQDDNAKVYPVSSVSPGVKDPNRTDDPQYILRLISGAAGEHQGPSLRSG
jgi:hypothetical protein